LRLSIVIPVRNEAAMIAAALQRLTALRHRGVEVIVVDGGSQDETVAIAAPLADRVLNSPPGRALQMNAGASVASGDTLLFLHADTRLPDDAFVAIARALTSRSAQWGRFDVHIEGHSRWLRVVAAMMNWRSRWSGIATGDQAIFVRTATFAAVRGYPDIALMEDIELSKTLKLLAAPVCLRERVVTSGRRWDQHGVWRTITLMWWLRFLYFVGVSPARLVSIYYRR
jgi:rSAM/selenodomain-associated transferase 2